MQGMITKLNNNLECSHCGHLLSNDKPITPEMQQGLEGEYALRNWFDANDFSYLYVRQSRFSYSEKFDGNVKRPDFLMLIEAIGMIAIDVKHYKSYDGLVTMEFDGERCFALDYQEEFEQALNFEHIFRVPLWYVFKEKNNADMWYWIHLLKALEVGRKTTYDGRELLHIPLAKFISVQSGEDIGKLHTMNLGNYSDIKISASKNN
jgi:hypothetical protein